MKVVLLLVISNIFMTIAWYGHLKHPRRSIFAVIIVSWLIALPEYAFQVPANRLGAQTFSLTQLKIMQEAITLVIFTIFAFFVFRERPRWNIAVSYGLVLLAVYFAFKG